MERQLIEIDHEWVCSLCGFRFYNPGCFLIELTLTEIIERVKKMREKDFAIHVCVIPLKKKE
jgi:hypothetical protein